MQMPHMNLKQIQLLEDCKSWLCQDVADIESQLRGMSGEAKKAAIKDVGSYLADTKTLITRIEAELPTVGNA